jgi:hypothetical protein
LVHFAIDAKASALTGQAFGIRDCTVMAKFAIRDFDVEIELLPEEMQKASVLGTINAGSLEIADEVSSSDHREIGPVMFDEVLETHLGRRRN